MKITNINYSDEPSGSSIAVNRISKMLNNGKIISDILVFKSISENQKSVFSSFFIKIDEYVRFFFKIALKKILSKIFNIKFEYTINFCLLPSTFLNKINNSNSDLINLHWIGNEMLSTNQITKITKPVIWTLHDMWPYTSVENYIDFNEFVEKYVKNKKNINFISNFFLKKKIKNFKNIKAVICTSNWQKKLCEQSEIFNNAKKVLIPLPIDFEIWKPIEKITARNLLKIPENANVIYFNLSHPYAKKRKGFDFIINFLEETDLKNIFFISANCESIKIKNPNITHINFNELKNLKDRISIYSASDIVVSPSRLESFGQTVLEAQACGIPVVTFKNTGSEDIIKHLETGYCCDYLNKKDFIKGIEWCLKQNFDKEIIINYSKNKFSNHVIREQYKIFFKNLDLKK